MQNHTVVVTELLEEGAFIFSIQSSCLNIIQSLYYFDNILDQNDSLIRQSLKTLNILLKKRP